MHNALQTATSATLSPSDYMQGTILVVNTILWLSEGINTQVDF